MPEAQQAAISRRGLIPASLAPHSASRGHNTVDGRKCLR